jgi:predicted tellurium resistance membrane protein TerC
MIILTIIIVWLITLITLVLGGGVVLYFKAPQVLKEGLNRVTTRKKTSLGPVSRPTAQQVNKRGSIIEEGEEEFAKQLKKVGITPVE